jgi:hypothetical protein
MWNQTFKFILKFWISKYNVFKAVKSYIINQLLRFTKKIILNSFYTFFYKNNAIFHY